MKLFEGHSFHIPVLGLGYSIDAPINVAHYGISSVISVVDDALIERLREFYCKKFDIPFSAISKKVEDFRAKRIASYLNLVEEIVNKKVSELKSTVANAGDEIEKYISMLPDSSSIKVKFDLARKGKKLLKIFPIGYRKNYLLVPLM